MVTPGTLLHTRASVQANVKESYTAVALLVSQWRFYILRSGLQTDPRRFLPGCHCRVRISGSCLACHAAWCHRRDRRPGCRRPSASSGPSERRKRLDIGTFFSTDFLNVACGFAAVQLAGREKAECTSALRRPTLFQWQQEMRRWIYHAIISSANDAINSSRVQYLILWHHPGDSLRAAAYWNHQHLLWHQLLQRFLGAGLCLPLLGDVGTTAAPGCCWSERFFCFVFLIVEFPNEITTQIWLYNKKCVSSDMGRTTCISGNKMERVKSPTLVGHTSELPLAVSG